ncbi:MAG TPA: DUF2723 domain-containing protein [Bacteroidales bacterium]|nr:DUF2723 domain-containing protein [Bacteroidales bacterium]HPS73834.1 DUF2723 domain-containing protein [Bacteroidales bacterium]
MKRYKRLNTILGWVVFLISAIVFILTAEPTMSFWDCGEYISTAFKLEVGHPPGAPLFQLLGRFFSLFAFGDVTQVARMINTMSCLSSAFTILFLFWSITMIAKKIVNRTGEMTNAKMYMIFGAGLVGALAYTFTDSFWFSAVEGEVYAMSSFFTAIVFWAILKWDEVADEEHSYRWLILIAFMIGLSIGVHLLNLLAIPAISFVYYFRKHDKVTWKGIVGVLIISILILALVMYVIIPYVLQLAGWFELAAVNGLGLPFNIGTLIFFLLLIGGIVWGLWYTRKKVKPVLNAVILAFAFILIGYSSFLVLVIRSNANTPIDENNPENAMYLLAYMNREQYGDWPLLKGQYYNAPVISRENGKPVYAKDSKSGKYIITDKRENFVPVYDPRFTTIFPRMWANMEERYAKEYIRWGNVKGVPLEVQGQQGTETRYKPTFSENLRFFWNYQFVHMYYRYFMWNFAGRQNDLQGMGSKIEGNWKSGIGFLDRARLGSQDLPESLKNNADNKFYLLPLILGLIGVWYSFRKNSKMGFVILLLFFMTGLAIVLYLNQYAPQPRERDYAYAASFYAFAMWIGLGVLALVDWLSKILNPKISAFAVTAVCLVLVPGVMAQQGWDDHDRSGRYTALAVAEDYLNSCEPNAILFANGDNDTFPLWYAQEVEGIRTDVRVVNLSLLNTDWYIDAMKRKVYDTDPVPFSLTRDKYRTGNHDVTYLFEDPKLKGQFVPLRILFDIINKDESQFKMNTEQLGEIDYFPVKSFLVPFDSATVIRNGYVPKQYASRLDTIAWTINRQGIEKSDLMILDLLAHNDWKRPVYFVGTTGLDTYLGLNDYLFLEGLTYRLLPVRAVSRDGQLGEVNTAAMYDHVVNKFKWGNMQDLKVNLDDNNKRMVMNMRNNLGRLASALALEGKKDSARTVIDIAMKYMPDEQTKYDYFIIPLATACYQIGDVSRGTMIMEKILKYKKDELAYYFSFPVTDLKNMGTSIQEALFSLNNINEVAKDYGQKKLSAEADVLLQKYYRPYMEHVYQQDQ